MKRLELALFPGSVIQAPVETLAVGIPEDERPLRGNAGFVDWRLGGELSRQLKSGFVSGEPGEAVLLPAQRPFAAARILLFGLGPADGTGRVLQRAFAVGAAKLLGLRTPLALLKPRIAEDPTALAVLDQDLGIRQCRGNHFHLRRLHSLRGE